MEIVAIALQIQNVVPGQCTGTNFNSIHQVQSMVMVMPLTMIVPGMPVLIWRIRLIIRMG